MEEDGAPPAPAHLSERAASFWRHLMPDRCGSPGRILLLEAALDALDRADEAAELIKRDGLVTKSERSGVVHAHPAIAVEAAARRQFIRLWMHLGLDFDSDLDVA
jgi:P27 family predicted phage terminase small subunit